MDSLKDQVAIITGGSQGIGAAIAHKLAADGAKLVLVARTESNLETIAQAIDPLTEVAIVPADIAVEANVERIVKAATGRFGRIDILINNAGLYIEKPFEECTTDEVDAILGVDLRGMFLLTRAVIPYIKTQGYGAIVNMASEMGLIGVENQALHCACKFAIVGFSQALFHELRRHNIRVSYVCPNATNTWGDEDPSVYLRPEDVADMVHFILTAHPNNTVAQVVLRSLKPLA